MKIFSKIDIGRVRLSNQDACFTRELPDSSVLAIVCDGMGGAKAGNIASENAVRLISDYVLHSYRRLMDSGAVCKLLKNAVRSANIEIYDMSMKSADLSGMGTTAVVALVTERFAVVAHVGDSRAYLVGDTVTQLTRDHSVVQSLIESGRLTPEQAKVHPRKNVITRAIGTEEDVTADCDELVLENGQTLLLCTDGLSNYLEPSEILETFRSNEISRVADQLVALANQNGGGDNITVVTVTQEKKG